MFVNCIKIKTNKNKSIKEKDMNFLPCELKKIIFSFDGDWKYVANTNSLLSLKKLRELKYPIQLKYNSLQKLSYIRLPFLITQLTKQQWVVKSYFLIVITEKNFKTETTSFRLNISTYVFDDIDNSHNCTASEILCVICNANILYNRSYRRHLEERINKI